MSDQSPLEQLAKAMSAASIGTKIMDSAAEIVNKESFACCHEFSGMTVNPETGEARPTSITVFVVDDDVAQVMQHALDQVEAFKQAKANQAATESEQAKNN